MDLIDTLNISGAGLNSQRVRLQTISSNMANARTTRTAEGGHYLRRVPVLESTELDPFGSALDQAMASVDVAEIATTGQEGNRVYEPGHPDADADGFVTYPEIDILREMVDLMTASRSYEANATAADTTKQLALRALEIGR